MGWSHLVSLSRIFTLVRSLTFSQGCAFSSGCRTSPSCVAPLIRPLGHVLRLGEHRPVRFLCAIWGRQSFHNIRGTYGHAFGSSANGKCNVGVYLRLLSHEKRRSLDSFGIRDWFYPLRDCFKRAITISFSKQIRVCIFRFCHRDRTERRDIFDTFRHWLAAFTSIRRLLLVVGDRKQIHRRLCSWFGCGVIWTGCDTAQSE